MDVPPLLQFVYSRLLYKLIPTALLGIFLSDKIINHTYLASKIRVFIWLRAIVVSVPRYLLLGVIMDPMKDYLVQNQSQRMTSIFLSNVLEDSRDRATIFFGGSDISEFFKGLGRLFYVVSPSETIFKDPREVPSYFANVSYHSFLRFTSRLSNLNNILGQ